MMKKVALLCLATLLSIQMAQAQIILKQKSEGEHRISLAFIPQQYLNGINISGEGTPQVLHTQNTFGYKMGLDYQRTTRYGLIFGGGIYYGSQRNAIDVVYESDMRWFDPYSDDPERLANTEEAKFNYAFTSKYAALQLKAGYSFKLPASWGKGWKLEATLGITSRLYLNNANDSIPEQDLGTRWSMVYPKGGVDYSCTFAQESGAWSGKGILNLAETFEGYVGISKAVKLGWVNNLSVGFELGGSILNRGGTGILRNSIFNFYGERIAHNIYRSKDFSIGVKVAVGLWPNIKGGRK